MKAGEIRTQATEVIQARADDSTPRAPPSPSCKISILRLVERNGTKLLEVARSRDAME